MRSPFCFIARAFGDVRYENVQDGLIVNSSEEDARFSNRRAVVIELPVDYDGPVQKGDTLLVHHNVFKFYNDMSGARKSGKSFFKDGLFMVDPDQFFMYYRDGIWHSYDRYCFVRPVSVDQAESPLTGVMVYPNEYILSKGIIAGDLVCYTPDSEYQFIVDGETLYRIFDHQITMKL